MGGAITHCGRCGLRLSPEELRTGAAVSIGSPRYCKGCVPQPTSPRPTGRVAPRPAPAGPPGFAPTARFGPEDYPQPRSAPPPAPVGGFDPSGHFPQQGPRGTQKYGAPPVLPPDVRPPTGRYPQGPAALPPPYPQPDTGRSGFPQGGFAPPSASFPASAKFLPPSSNYGPPSNYAPPSPSYAPSGSFVRPATGSFGPPNGNFTPPTGNFAPPSGNFTPPTGNFAPPSGNFGPPPSGFPQSGGFGSGFPASGGGGFAPSFPSPAPLRADTKQASPDPEPPPPPKRQPRKLNYDEGDGERGRLIALALGSAGVTLIVIILITVVASPFKSSPGITPENVDRAALDEARAWAKAHPEELAAQAARYQTLVEKSTDPTVIKEAKDLLDDARRLDAAKNQPGEAARKSCDELLERARKLEAQGDLDGAVLFLDAPPDAVRKDDALRREVQRERDRINEQRQLARARKALDRGDGPAALDALRDIRESPRVGPAVMELMAKAEALIGATGGGRPGGGGGGGGTSINIGGGGGTRPPTPRPPSPPPSGGGGGNGQRQVTREEWIQAVCAAANATPDDFLAKRTAAIEAAEKQAASWKDAPLLHRLEMHPNGKSLAGSRLGRANTGTEAIRAVQVAPENPIFYMVLERPQQARICLGTEPSKPLKRVAVRLKGGAAPIAAAIKDYCIGKIRCTLDGKDIGELNIWSSDFASETVLDVSSSWKGTASNALALTFLGPSPVLVQKVEVIGE